MTQHFAAQVVLADSVSAEQAERAQKAFAALGFGLGPLVGGSFSIDAAEAVFVAVFGVRLQARSDGGVAVRGAPSGTPAGELPRAALPATLRPLLAHVLFTEPPAFGPGGEFSRAP